MRIPSHLLKRLVSILELISNESEMHSHLYLSFVSTQSTSCNSSANICFSMINPQSDEIFLCQDDSISHSLKHNDQNHHLINSNCSFDNNVSRSESVGDLVKIADITFKLSEVEILVAEISKSLDHNLAAARESFKIKARGIDWDAVTLSMNELLNVTRASHEYRRMWKYVAYGEVYSKDTETYPESDEENGYYQPYSAISRFDSSTFELLNNVDNQKGEAKSSLASDQPTDRVRVLRLNRGIKHPSKKVKLIISNSHAEDTNPPVSLVCIEERYLQAIKDENRYSKSKGAFASALRSIPRIMGNHKASDPPIVNRISSSSVTTKVSQSSPSATSSTLEQYSKQLLQNYVSTAASQSFKSKPEIKALQTGLPHKSNSTLHQNLNTSMSNSVPTIKPSTLLLTGSQKPLTQNSTVFHPQPVVMNKMVSANKQSIPTNLLPTTIDAASSRMNATEISNLQQIPPNNPVTTNMVQSFQTQSISNTPLQQSLNYNPLGLDKSGDK